jgi:hypothetical protein
MKRVAFLEHQNRDDSFTFSSSPESAAILSNVASHSAFSFVGETRESLDEE